MIPGKQYKPSDIVAILRRRWWIIVLPLIVVSIGTATVTRFIPNRYRSETLILVVPQRVPESYVKSTVTTRIEDRLQSISQQILSRTRLERIIVDLNLYQQERKTGLMEDIVAKMRQDITPEVVKGDAFRISYTGEEPRTVMQATERIASLFIEENLRDRAQVSENAYEFLDSQLVDARARLKEHEKKLEEYRRRYSGELPTQLQSNLQMIQNIQLQVQSLSESMARDRDRRLIVQRGIADISVPDPVPAAGGPAQPVAEGAELSGDNIARQLEQQEQLLRQLQLRFTADHPDVRRTKRTIAMLAEKLKSLEGQEPIKDPAALAASQTRSAKENRLKELRVELEAIDRQLARKEADEKRLRDSIQAYQSRVEAAPSRETELTELMRDYDTLKGTYTSLLAKKEDSKIAANLEQRQIGEQFKILDPARLPERPYSPNRLRLNVMGALFGFLLGVGIVALLEYADSTLKSDDDVLSALALPVLALVPKMVTTREQMSARRRRLIVAAVSSVGVVVLTALAVWVVGTQRGW